jgi:hypothetical protein
METDLESGMGIRRDSKNSIFGTDLWAESSTGDVSGSSDGMKREFPGKSM